jgi:hypothetical protein
VKKRNFAILLYCLHLGPLADSTSPFPVTCISSNEKLISFIEFRRKKKTLPTINKPRHPKKGKTRNKMGAPTFKKTNEPPKRVDNEGNIKFLNPLHLTYI